MNVSGLAALPTPMLAPRGNAPRFGGLRLRVKWDGFRAIVSTMGGLRVRSRRAWDMASLVQSPQTFRPGARPRRRADCICGERGPELPASVRADASSAPWDSDHLHDLRPPGGEGPEHPSLAALAAPAAAGQAEPCRRRFTTAKRCSHLSRIRDSKVWSRRSSAIPTSLGSGFGSRRRTAITGDGLWSVKARSGHVGG
jgi:hypothetical protein